MRSVIHSIRVFLEMLVAPVVFEILVFPILLLMTFGGRFSKKPIEIGLGPEPFVSHIYHKKALERLGYSVHTYVNIVYFITDQFDIRADRWIKNKHLKRLLLPIVLFIWSVYKYKCVYIYFNGGPLGLGTVLLWRIEPYLYHLANTKVVVMPYGGDVQDMSRSPNLLFKDAMRRDYPGQRLRRPRIEAQIDLWTQHGDHVIGGCDWVDYMYHWDTLMLAHFSIDLDRWTEPAPEPIGEKRKLRILHAPNHRAIKGTEFFIKAVNELKAEGLDLELVLVERVANDRIHELMTSVDVVADQLIIGWYAMFALEGMAMGKPVLCYLRSDLEKLYEAAGLIQPGEIPILNCTPFTVKEAIRDLVLNPEKLAAVGRCSREFVVRHHSLEAIGKVFDGINRSLGFTPSLGGI